MTCIVGLREGDSVWLGGDSLATDFNYYLLGAQPKVFTLEVPESGSMVVGATGEIRLPQLLQHALTIPERRPGTDVMKWLVRDFIPAVRKTFKAEGYTYVENNREGHNGQFLVGFMGRLFKVESNFQITEDSRNVAAVGCGADFALGALFESKAGSPKAKLLQALRAAEAFSIGVRGPFNFVEAKIGGKESGERKR